MPNQPQSFNPQGAQEVSVKGLGPSLGKIDASTLARPQTMQQQMPMAQSQIGVGNAPRGAAPIAVSGPQTSAFKPSPQAFNPAPSHQPQMDHKSMKGSDAEVHKISVRGLAADGQEYVAKFDAVFPRNTKILGVTEQME